MVMNLFRYVLPEASAGHRCNYARSGRGACLCSLFLAHARNLSAVLAAPACYGFVFGRSFVLGFP